MLLFSSFTVHALVGNLLVLQCYSIVCCLLALQWKSFQNSLCLEIVQHMRQVFNSIVICSVGQYVTVESLLVFTL